MEKHLQSLTLKNFRSWKDGVVEFCPGINIITGENDSGKTNILRAINLVVNNRPSGEDFRSNWGGDTSALLKVENKIVGRHRKNNDNLYTLMHEDGAEDEFRAFGKKVPEVISQFLNFSEININFQLDGPFLLGLSPADVARYYNNAVNLDIIDRSISNITTLLKSEKAELEKTESDLETHEKNLKKYNWLDKAEEKLKELENLKLLIKRKDNQYSELSKLIYTINEINKELIPIQDIIKHEHEVKNLIDTQNLIVEKTNEIEKIKTDIDNIVALLKQEEKLQKILSFQTKTESLINQKITIDNKNKEYLVLEQCLKIITSCINSENKLDDFIKYNDLVKKLEKLDDEIESKTNEYNKLYDCLEKIKQLSKDYEEITNERELLEKEFNKLMPDLCPLCGK